MAAWWRDKRVLTVVRKTTQKVPCWTKTSWMPSFCDLLDTAAPRWKETDRGGVLTCGLNAASIPRTIFSASRPGCGVSRAMQEGESETNLRSDIVPAILGPTQREIDELEWHHACICCNGTCDVQFLRLRVSGGSRALMHQHQHHPHVAAEMSTFRNPPWFGRSSAWDANSRLRFGRECPARSHGSPGCFNDGRYRRTPTPLLLVWRK